MFSKRIDKKFTKIIDVDGIDVDDQIAKNTDDKVQNNQTVSLNTQFEDFAKSRKEELKKKKQTAYEKLQKRNEELEILNKALKEQLDFVANNAIENQAIKIDTKSDTKLQTVAVDQKKKKMESITSSHRGSGLIPDFINLFSSSEEGQEATITYLENKITDLENQLLSKNKEIFFLQRDKANLNGSANYYLDEVNDQKGTVASLKNTIETLLITNLELEKQLKLMQTALLQQEEQHEIEKEQQEEKHKEYDKKRDELRLEFMDTAKRANDRAAELEEKEAGYKKEIAEQERTIQALKQEFIRIEEKLKIATTAVGKFEASLKKAQAEKRELETKCKSLGCSIFDLDSKYKDIQFEQQKEINRLNKSNSFLQQTIEQHELEIYELKQPQKLYDGNGASEEQSTNEITALTVQTMKCKFHEFVDAYVEQNRIYQGSSLFSKHGSTGRQVAREFRERFKAKRRDITSKEDLMGCLVELKEENKILLGGNYNPGSFKTYLLAYYEFVKELDINDKRNDFDFDVASYVKAKYGTSKPCDIEAAFNNAFKIENNNRVSVEI